MSAPTMVVLGWVVTATVIDKRGHKKRAPISRRFQVHSGAEDWKRLALKAHPDAEIETVHGADDVGML